MSSSAPCDHGLMPDVVTLGEVMVRLTPPPRLRLEPATGLTVMVGGAEANAAVALARLGLRAGWISKLPDHPLGRLIAGELARHGVDTSRVVWAPEGRVGLYFYEPSAPPRPARVWYDRAGSAVTTLEEREVDWAYLTEARVVLVSGITPALSPRLHALTLRIAREVKGAGKRFALDVNYRAKLWAPAAAAACLSELLPSVAVLFCGMGDARTVFGLAGEPEAAARALQEKFGVQVVVLTLGAQGSVAAADRVYRQRRVPRVEVCGDMELVEDDLPLSPQEMGAGGLPGGLPHVQGHGSDPGQLLGRERGPEAVEAFLLPVVSQVEDPPAVQIGHPRQGAMTRGDSFFVR